MPELQQKPLLKRQVAYKVGISEILSSSFVNDESFADAVIINGLKVTRVNIIATLVYKPENNTIVNAIIDDGTGSISLRSFEHNSVFLRVHVGDIILVIGRVREFLNERYIAPEILRKLDNIGWLTARKIELKNVNIASENNLNVVKEENSHESIYADDKICDMIEKLDTGDGVVIENLIIQSDDPDTERIIDRLIKKGDIFQIKPGIVKVLK